MAFKESQGYCKKCEENILIRAETPNHVLHLIITIFTLSLWVIVWIGLSIKPKEWRCTKCGNLVLSSEMRGTKECPHCNEVVPQIMATCPTCNKWMGV